MTTPTLWIEITIAGALYLAGLCFLFLGAYGIAAPSTPVEIKEYLPYLSVAAVGASYIVGILMHRVSQLLAWPAFLRLLRMRRFQEGKSAAEHFDDLVVIWQFGSQRVHRELDFQYSLVVLFRSLVLAIPFSFGSFEFWLVRTHHDFRLGLLAVGLGLWVLCLIVYRRQRRQYHVLLAAAIGRVPKVKTGSG